MGREGAEVMSERVGAEEVAPAPRVLKPGDRVHIRLPGRSGTLSPGTPPGRRGSGVREVPSQGLLIRLKASRSELGACSSRAAGGGPGTCGGKGGGGRKDARDADAPGLPFFGVDLAPPPPRPAFRARSCRSARLRLTPLTRQRWK
ncbi:MAG: hypothetical protein LBQ79_10920 [Deltaproteobacteria bacterium]|jgi:hypothetical protein|nr:hypothetical protein [Deltaproteobacteria bacterium]